MSEIPDPSYPIKIILQHQTLEKPEIIWMRCCNWMDDSSLINQSVRADGKLDHNNIWIERLKRDFKGFDEKAIRSMPSWKMSALKVKWLEYNDVSPASFLVNEQEQVNPPQ